VSWNPDPNKRVQIHAGVTQRLNASSDPLPKTSKSDVARTLRSFRSSSRVPAISGKVVLTTADEKAKMTRPTIATAAYSPAMRAGKKCFTKTISQLLIKTWPEKKTSAWHVSRIE